MLGSVYDRARNGRITLTGHLNHTTAWPHGDMMFHIPVPLTYHPLRAVSSLSIEYGKITVGLLIY